MHENGKQCVDCWGEEGITGLNGNGKIQQKIKGNKKKLVSDTETYCFCCLNY